MSHLYRLACSFLFIPFNTMAHPGHDGIVMPSSTDDFIKLAACIAIALAVSAGLALLIYRGKRAKTEHVNE